jgi:hypothetical protein
MGEVGEEKDAAVAAWAGRAKVEDLRRALALISLLNWCCVERWKCDRGARGAAGNALRSLLSEILLRSRGRWWGR